MWRAALKGIDLICRAPTGSGKTLAYLLHAAAHCEAQPRAPPAGAGPAVLVLVPTRELALQVGGGFKFVVVHTCKAGGGGSTVFADALSDTV